MAPAALWALGRALRWASGAGAGAGSRARRGLALNNPERFELLGGEGGGAPPRVSGFGPGGFHVDGARVEGAVVLCGGRVFGWRGVRKHTDVGPGSLGVLEVLRPRADILVVGSGQNTVRPSEALRDYARAQGCALEVQATAAAVSTYNVLSQEGRRVVAVLLPEDAESGPSGFGSYFPI